mmetsp:Transcript_4640/g.13427  ORF Transcript_4640/g.13427 Transcript_4640/m.13427 type:complete len:221 (+) Transcript_4640:861-1523(+)
MVEAIDHGAKGRALNDGRRIADDEGAVARTFGRRERRLAGGLSLLDVQLQTDHVVEAPDPPHDRQILEHYEERLQQNTTSHRRRNRWHHQEVEGKHAAQHHGKHLEWACRLHHRKDHAADHEHRDGDPNCCQEVPQLNSGLLREAPDHRQEAHVRVSEERAPYEHEQRQDLRREGGAEAQGARDLEAEQGDVVARPATCHQCPIEARRGGHCREAAGATD